jgi:hypothetical protein
MVAKQPWFNEFGGCMRATLIFIAAAALGGCQANLPAKQDGSSSEASADTSGFPKAGNYHVVHDSGAGAHTERKETDMWVDASDAGKFEELIAGQSSGNCRDRNVRIDKGSFSVSMTCDAPDGDIHNIRMERHGSYSEDSIDIQDETSFWGMSMRESRSYRLKG